MKWAFDISEQDENYILITDIAPGTVFFTAQQRQPYLKLAFHEKYNAIGLMNGEFTLIPNTDPIQVYVGSMLFKNEDLVSKITDLEEFEDEMGI